MNLLRIYNDAFRYALSDSEVILVIGIVLLMNSIVNKYFGNRSMFHLSNIIMLVAIGYGSMVSMYTIRGSDTLPEIRNIKRIVWEGIKKSLIIAFYTIFSFMSVPSCKNLLSKRQLAIVYNLCNPVCFSMVDFDWWSFEQVFS